MAGPITFRQFFNSSNIWTVRDGRTPETNRDDHPLPARFGSYEWKQHCRGLYQTPMAVIMEFAMDKSKNIKKTKASGMDKHLSRSRIMDCVSGKRDYAAEELKHLTSCSTCQAVQTVIMKSRAAAENQNEERRSRRPNRRKRQYRV